MSDDTIDRQHTSLEDETNDEKIPKTSITVTPSLRSKTHLFAAESIKTFHKFSELPRELQLMIFQNALPASRIVCINFYVIDRGGAISAGLYVCIAKSPGLLPLLETCTASNASIYLDGGFVKIKVEPLKSGPALYSRGIRTRDFPVHYEDLGNKKRNYTYMRPSQDILMVNANSLLKLYRYGGSLNLEGVTHIALRDIEWVPAMDSMVDSQKAVQGMIDLLNLIEAQCSNLKRLSFVANIYGHYGDRTTNDTQLLDINNDLLKLDLRDKRGYEVPDSANCRLYEMLSCLLRERNFFDHKIQKHHERIEEQGNKDSIAYWKGVEVVYCLHCRSKNYHDESKFYIPNPYIPLLDCFVRCNDDGTLATLLEDVPDSLIELRNTLSLIKSRNEMPVGIQLVAN
ncbi:hypothetical protein OCU04_006589 [Sclerotinia nivalis]|uniref:2EXR domain-containing protein n=1 Tax=Sclerotinia nivalis TaxID=352851 RepID=A0A9X0AK39_9HELO|nr:hypothetical protein OCU04_006589 [Sclerotinia nivalis]